MASVLERAALLLLAVALAGCSPSKSDDGATSGKPPTQGPPDHVVGSFVVQLPEVTLQPGDEIEPCYLVPLVVSGPSRIVGGASLTTQQGMHHGNVTTRKSTGPLDGVRPCPADVDAGFGAEAIDVLNGGTVLFGSSTQKVGTEWQSFPRGMGYRIADGYDVVARMHYLNATTHPLTVAPRYEWLTIDPASVTQELGAFAWVYKDFTIPPNATFTATGSCAFGTPMHIVNGLPHMHRLGTKFEAAFLGGPRDGQRFLDSPGYDPDKGVMVEWDPPVDLTGADGVTFSCTWNNTLDKSITWGVGDNEMCVLYGYAYPPENAYSVVAGPSGCFKMTPNK